MTTGRDAASGRDYLTPDALNKLLAAARAWAAQDPNPLTRAELEADISAAALNDKNATSRLGDGFSERLKFGTAGLRGQLGPGPGRMNRVLVGQAAAGLGRFLKAKLPGHAPLIVIGFDARRESDVFARDSAEILRGAGCRVALMPRQLPTPVLAYAVRALSADAGVMVTASHNPPDDNGYKVYLGASINTAAANGAQIAPPTDAEIAAEISFIADNYTFAELPKSSDYQLLAEQIVSDYIERTAAVAPAAFLGVSYGFTADAEAAVLGETLSYETENTQLKWVYTAMHGVGYETMLAVAAASGYPAPIPVSEQVVPDAAFPTVSFPNPEEPGALDLAIACASEHGAELILANDPDADRLAVAVPERKNPGNWVQLSGNQIGLLLGWWRAEELADAAAPASLACSLVSSPALRLVAQSYGLAFHATMTGFKWIARAPGLVYGFEEALGYLVNPETVLDKDGISAAVAILNLSDRLRRTGRNLLDMWQDFCEKFGFFQSLGLTIRLERRSELSGLMTRLREIAPLAFGSYRVSEMIDYLPIDGNDLIEFRLGDFDRVLVRPSGTEPKLKLYIDVRGDSEAHTASKSAELADFSKALLAQLS